MMLIWWQVLFAERYHLYEELTAGAMKQKSVESQRDGG